MFSLESPENLASTQSVLIFAFILRKFFPTGNSVNVCLCLLPVLFICLNSSLLALPYTLPHISGPHILIWWIPWVFSPSLPSFPSSFSFLPFIFSLSSLCFLPFPLSPLLLTSLLLFLFFLLLLPSSFLHKLFSVSLKLQLLTGPRPQRDYSETHQHSTAEHRK